MSTTFSVIESAQASLKEFGLPISDSVDLDRYIAKSGETTSMSGTAKGLLNWCRDMERAVVSRPLRGCSVYAGFERLSRARFVEKRYKEMGAVTGALHIFGQPDAELGFPATQLHTVTAGPLVLEWFLIVQDAGFSGLLSARDLDGFDTRISPRERRFEGLITHDARVIKRVVEEIDDNFPAR